MTETMVVAAPEAWTDPISLTRAAEIDREINRLKRREKALRQERAEIIDALAQPGGYEERTPYGTYRLIPRTRRTPRSIDTERFVERHPDLVKRCGTVKISVLKAEAVLSEEEFEEVVIPGAEVDVEPEIVFETSGPREEAEP